MSRKDKKFVWAKRTNLRRFVDLLNGLGIFNEKILYPVMHPSRTLTDEEVRKVMFLDLDNEELFKGLSDKEKEELQQHLEENYESQKEIFKTQGAYVDFEKKVLTFKDSLDNILVSKKVKDKMNDFYKYIYEKIENNTDSSVEGESDDSKLYLKVHILDKREDGVEIIYKTYFWDILFVEADEGAENEKGFCDFYLDIDFCSMVVYF